MSQGTVFGVKRFCDGLRSGLFGLDGLSCEKGKKMNKTNHFEQILNEAKFDCKISIQS